MRWVHAYIGIDPISSQKVATRGNSGQDTQIPFPQPTSLLRPSAPHISSLWPPYQKHNCANFLNRRQRSAHSRHYVTCLPFSAGEQGTLPLTGDGYTKSHALQIVAVLLKKKDKNSFHHEIQFGPTILSNHGPGASGPTDSKTDFGLLGILNLANMPGSGGRFN